jgi:hypothetical protein
MSEENKAIVRRQIEWTLLEKQPELEGAGEGADEPRSQQCWLPLLLVTNVFHLAPPVEHKPIGPCAKTATVSPNFTFPLSAAEIPGDAISASNTTCSSDKSSTIFARFACASGTSRYSACAPSSVPEFPSADRPTALRPIPRSSSSCTARTA